jgi:hypothetical protein
MDEGLRLPALELTPPALSSYVDKCWTLSNCGTRKTYAAALIARARKANVREQSVRIPNRHTRLEQIRDKEQS